MAGSDIKNAPKKPKHQIIRNYKVIKSNDLIQRSKFELSAQEQNNALSDKQDKAG